MDDDLAAIRAKRMAEMKAQAGNSMPAGMASMGAPNGQEKDNQIQMDEMRRNMIAQILTPDARERLARIRIVKEDKATGVEEMLIRMAKSGQIRGKVTETQLIDLLNQISEQNTVKTKIKFVRRTDSDDDLEELLK
ncbi:programmed cell death protein 5 [Globomyces pollinis-pini]|nr:programmed cell death protein 5 [Globomyces pollinis-pini]